MTANYRRFGIAAAVVSLLFAWPLFQWASFALGSDLYSHALLIPFVSVGLIWLRRANLPASTSGSPAGAGFFAVLALTGLAYAVLSRPSTILEPHNRLSWTIAAYVCLLIAAGFWFLGGRFMRANVVPAALLVFMIPMPGWLERATEMALQRGSAEAADILFAASGIPYLRDGQVFRLPSITMEIAQECSGIHASLVLFITSIVAGQMFVKPGWRRWVLTLAVIPLALVRNGFRVLTLGWLCENIGPHMIDHWIHHRGGPVFFALSLIPFFLLLVVLRERRSPRPALAPSPAASARANTPAEISGGVPRPPA